MRKGTAGKMLGFFSGLKVLANESKVLAQLQTSSTGALSCSVS